MRACRQSMFAAVLACGVLGPGESGAVPIPAGGSYGNVYIFDIEITGGVVDSIDVPATTLDIYRQEGTPPNVVVSFTPGLNLARCAVGGSSCRIEVGGSITITVVDGVVEGAIHLAGFELMIESESGGTVELRRSNAGGQTLGDGSDPQGSAAITGSTMGEFRLGDEDDFDLETPSILLDLPAGLTRFYWEGASIEFFVERRLGAVDVAAPASAALLLAAIGGMAGGRRARPRTPVSC